MILHRLTLSSGAHVLEYGRSPAEATELAHFHGLIPEGETVERAERWNDYLPN